ncbi:unnamed protein product [Brugia timori]|uniref:Uncharacterized protein n=1 Tax=Brugia timori TaxID=42155 RepID=A0A0R3R5U8_9BILA|nr:unnamed protein product [Brugia timori]
MFKSLFRPRRSNKENENQEQYLQQQRQHSANEFERNSSSYKSLRSAREKRSFHSSHHHRGSAGTAVDDGLPASTSPYHIAIQKKYPRGTQSCYDGLGDDFDRFSTMNRSFVSVTHSKYKVFFIDFCPYFPDFKTTKIFAQNRLSTNVLYGNVIYCLSFIA